jgi:hypothetical protein
LQRLALLEACVRRGAEDSLCGPQQVAGRASTSQVRAA